MRIIRPPLLALAALLGAVSAPPLPAQTIDTILIDNTGVFEGPGFLSRLAAHTHITTQARVIRRAILLRQCDSFDPNLVAASERALWTLGVFRSVKLDTLRLADGRLALRVATADGWSARPVLDYATVQGAKSWELGVLEQNFLGTATQVFATYRSTPDRGWLLFQYWNPHFLSPATILFLRHVQLSNGRHWVWMGGLPFRHAGARSSVTTEGWAVEERTLVFEQGGATLAPSRMRTLQFRLNAAYAVHAAPTSYVRTWVALRGSRDSWAPDATTPFNTLATAAAGAGVELGLARYRVTQALNTHSRREHVDVSQVLRLGLWSAPRRWGTRGDRAGFGLEGRWQGAIAGPRGHAVLRVEATAARAAATGALDSGRVRLRATVVGQLRPHHATVVHADVFRMFGQRPPGEYDFWFEQRGPRLFQPHTFIGFRTAWVALEHRVALGSTLGGLVGLGAAPFVDYARARRMDGRAAEGGDAGLALRLAPLRMASGDVTELALGYRFGGGRGGSAGPGSRWGVSIRKAVTF